MPSGTDYRANLRDNPQARRLPTGALYSGASFRGLDAVATDRARAASAMPRSR